MNKQIIRYILGWMLRIESMFMVPALMISIYQGEKSAVFGFLATIILALTVSMVISNKKPEKFNFYAHEGFVTVALAWIIMSAVGSMPFFLSGSIPNIIDALFETISGFTTTGASILTEIETLPMGILYWRAFTHWLGGMGVLVFLLAIMPATKDRGHAVHLLRAESPGPIVDKLVPKMHKSAKILYGIYIAFTIAEVLLLLAGGMPLFDSVTNALATAGTGGFAIKNASIAAYDSYYLQSVITVFMILFGINFNMFYLILIGEISQVMRNQEIKVYLGVMFIGIVLIAFNIFPLYENIYQAFHHASFQAASVMTTTGFATADFNLWPELSQMILIMLMLIGASAGSTGGGIKVSRIMILVKSLKLEIQKMMNPNSVKVIKMDGKVVPDSVVKGVNIYMAAYCLIVAFSILIISLDNFGFTTTVTSVIACANNIGPGLEMVGPTGNYSEFSSLSKIVLSLNMLVGRLEIFPMMLLFAPSTWRKKPM